MGVRFKQTGFTAGELHPRVIERTEAAQYRHGLLRARNVTLQPQGGAERREGMRYIDAFSDDGGGAPTAQRIVPFIFNLDQSYYFVFTHNKIAIYRSQTDLLVKTFAASGGDSVYTAGHLPGLRFVQSLDTLYIAHEALASRIVQRITDAEWTLEEFSFSVEATGTIGTRYGGPFARFADPDVTMSNGAITFDVDSLVTASARHFKPGHIAQYLQKVRPDSTLIDYAHMQIRTLGSVAIGNATFTTGSTAVTGSGTAWASQLYAGDYVYLSSDGQVDTVPGNGKYTPNAIRIATVTDNTNLLLAEAYPATGGGPAAGSRIGIGSPSILGVATLTNGSNQITGGASFTSVLHVGDRVYVTADGAVWGTRVQSIDSDTVATLDRNYGGAGGAGVNCSVDHGEGHVTCTVRNMVQTTTGATTDWAESAINFMNGYARSLGLYQDRLVLGGTRSRPDTVWMSKTSLYNNFDAPEGLADEGIQVTAVSNQINAIEQLYTLHDLIIGTSGAVLAESSRPVTPSSVGLTPFVEIGMSNLVAPVSLEGAVLYVSSLKGSARQRMLELLFQEGTQAYAATDITALAFHLINVPRGAAVRNGNSRTTTDHVFVVNTAANALQSIPAGSCAVLNTLRSQQITGWSLWTTDGEFLDVAEVAGEVYFLVKRAVNSADVYFIEKLDTETYTDSALLGGGTLGATVVAGLYGFTNGGDQVTGSGLLSNLTTDDFIFNGTDDTTVDAVQIGSIDSDTALTLSANYGGTTNASAALHKVNRTIAGLTRLEGEAVDVRLNGIYVGRYTVASGAMTLATSVAIADIVTYASTLEVGLPYAWQLVQLPQDVETDRGVTTNLPRRVVEAHISVLETNELQLRRWGSSGAGQRVVFKSFGATQMDTPEAGATLTKRVHLLGSDTTSQIELFGDEPLPAHVRAITLEVA